MATIVDWQDLPPGKEKYAKYLASREWATKKNAVRKRSSGTCERCHRDRASQCHHMDYTRLYQEPLTDLLDVCDACHRFISDKSDLDPVAYWREVEHEAKPYQFFVQHESLFVVQCPECKGEFDSVHLLPSQCKKIGHDDAVVVVFQCENDHRFEWTIRTRNGSTYLSSEKPYRNRPR